MFKIIPSETQTRKWIFLFVHCHRSSISANTTSSRRPSSKIAANAIIHRLHDIHIHCWWWLLLLGAPARYTGCHVAIHAHHVVVHHTPHIPIHHHAIAHVHHAVIGHHSSIHRHVVARVHHAVIRRHVSIHHHGVTAVHHPSIHHHGVAIVHASIHHGVTMTIVCHAPIRGTRIVHHGSLHHNLLGRLLRVTIATTTGRGNGTTPKRIKSWSAIRRARIIRCPKKCMAIAVLTRVGIAICCYRIPNHCV
mmetsp:Transcript_1164/g.2066  ORF Transcript_1164/g.2066 Transcript_1164/m.2066 type:complete len:249 (-) Transcript_1164:222-968(-)